MSFLEGSTSVTDVQSHHTTVCSLGKYVATDNLKRIKRVVDSEIWVKFLYFSRVWVVRDAEMRSSCVEVYSPVIIIPVNISPL